MDQKLRAFSLGSLPRGVDGGGLGTVVGGITLRAFPANRPVAVPWNNVNIFLHKQAFLLPVGFPPGG